MSQKNDLSKHSALPSSSAAPIKRLELRREKVRDLKVRTGVQTGGASLSSKGFSEAPVLSITMSSASGSDASVQFSHSQP